jgi:hypothetical protein
MTNRKTNEEIAELSCQFANYYFDDGAVPLPASLLAKRSEIQADRKVLTRLVPRFVAAHSYFGGYNDAQNEFSNQLASAQESERSVCEHAKQLEAEIEAMKKERDELRLHIASITSPSLEDVNRLADIAHAEYKRWKHGWHGVVTAIVVELAKSNQANIGIVVKPPPPPPPPAAPAPMPNELRPQIDDVLQKVRCEVLSRSFLRHEGSEWFDIKSLDQAIEKAAQEHIGDDLTMCHPPPAAPVRVGESVPTSNELSTEIDCELARAAAEYANRIGDDTPHVQDVRFVKEAIDGESGYMDDWNRDVCAFVAGARWQNDVRTRETFKDGTYPEAPKDIAVEETNPERLIFQSDDEREYWDSMTFMLARKGDTTAQSVSCAADEMVYERRARKQNEGVGNVVQRAFGVVDLLRQQGIEVAAVNRMVDGQSRVGIAFGHEQRHIVYIDRPRHAKMSITDIAESVADVFAEMSKKPEQATEVTNELLHEAAIVANKSNIGFPPIDMDGVRDALNRSMNDRSAMADFAVGYVRGALRTARKS